MKATAGWVVLGHIMELITTEVTIITEMKESVEIYTLLLTLEIKSDRIENDFQIEVL